MTTGRIARAARRYRFPLVLLGGAALAVVVGVAALRGKSVEDEPSTAAIDVIVRPVHRLSRSTEVAVSGEVEAQRSVDLGFKVSGVVARVFPEEGDAVRAGQLIAAIDPEDYRLNLELARAAADQARDSFERARQVFEGRGMAPADFTRAETAFRQANTQEQLARKQVADTRLVAPISGVVARRGIDPGEQAAPGVPVFTIVAMDPVQVRVGIPEAEIGRIQVGQTALVSIPSLHGARFEGQVRLVGVAADPVSRTYNVRIAIPNPDGVLRPGMIAEVSIRDGATIETLTLPGHAVVRDPRGVTQVFVYLPEEQRTYGRRVSVGSLFGQEVEITSGLTGDELVVVGGQHRVRDGTLVNASTEPQPAVVEGEVRP